MYNPIYRLRLWYSRLSGDVSKLILVYSALILAQSLFGLASVVYRVSLKGVAPLTFLFFRQTISGPLMTGVAYGVERQIPKLQHAPTFALAGFCGIFLGQTFYLLGVFFSGAILSSICQLIQAPLVASLAILFKMEKFSWLKMAGLGTSLAGAAVLIGGNGFNIGFSGEGTKSLGVVILVAQNILSSFMIILQKQLSNDHGPMTTAALITLSSVPWTVLTALVFISSKEWVVSPTAIGGILYAIIVVGLIAGNLYGWAVKNTDSSIVGASVTLNPLVASIFAAIFLGETVGLKDLIGGALILVGFGITSYAKFRETKEEEAAKRKLDPERVELIEEHDDGDSSISRSSSSSGLTDSSTSLEMSSMTSPKIELEEEDDDELN